MTIHIPGKENTTADALSRLSWLGDYKIKVEFLLPALTAINFSPTLDTFVLRTMKHFRRYFSPQDDRRAVARDAFSIAWANEKLLLHPPICAIPKVIQKLKRDGATTALILPIWDLMKYKTMIPLILNQKTLGPSEIVLEEGKLVHRLMQKLPPGIMEIVLINTLKENSCTESSQHNLDLDNQLLMN
ncbi:MAG: hypothetical protein EZS28_055302 [Streblomastix strix]|uniref:Uncharacterized protein n=1 Tax=Streblomastix strix TaxID=222440 RepID=A0A5J4Q2K9_9EUKA|nr:MAG: hypothetical protein EZS28_055302 [Streblomastix strix]